MTKTKIAFAAALFAATSSAAFAQGFDSSMANRYPNYANAQSQQTRTLQSAPVRLQQRNVALPNNGGVTGQSEINADRTDRASSPYAGGGY
jgi:hypothetical protein